MEEALDAVRVAFDEDTGIGNLTLDRPDSLNALNGQMSRDIVAGLELLERQNEGVDGVALRTVIVEGAGDRAFCAGADIEGFSSDASGGSSERDPFEFIMEYPAPVVAKIDGYCLGGGLEIALSCDFRLASEDSEFGLPEVDLGVLPGAGGVQLIAELCGPGFAKELAMTGDHISAERAADEGLVTDVYSSDEFEDRAEGFAVDLAGQAPLAVQAIKESANIAAQTGLQEGRQFDRQLFSKLLQTDDFVEGATAFQQDREPEFEGT